MNKEVAVRDKHTQILGDGRVDKWETRAVGFRLTIWSSSNSVDPHHPSWRGFWSWPYVSMATASVTYRSKYLPCLVPTPNAYPSSFLNLSPEHLKHGQSSFIHIQFSSRIPKSRIGRKLSMKRSPCGCKDPSVISTAHMRKLGSVTHACIPSTGAVVRGRQIHWVCGPATLGYLVGFRLSETLSQNK